MEVNKEGEQVITGLKRSAEEQITKETYNVDAESQEKSLEGDVWKPATTEEIEARRIVAAARKDTEPPVTGLTFATSVQSSFGSSEPVLPSFASSSSSLLSSSLFSSSSPKLDFAATPSLFGTLSSMPSSSTPSKPFQLDLPSSISPSSAPSQFSFNLSSLFSTQPSTSASSLPSKFTLSIPQSCESAPVFGVNIAAPLQVDQVLALKPPTLLTGDSSLKENVQKVDVVTGEEEEERIHSVRAKLLELDTTSTSPNWKERGVGQVHINASKTSSISRIVMRSEGILKLILNVPLFSTMACERVQDKGVRISPLGDNGKPRVYLLRVSRKEEANQLFEAIEQCKKKATPLTPVVKQAPDVKSTSTQTTEKEAIPPASHQPAAEQKVQTNDGATEKELTTQAGATPVAKLILAELDRFDAETGEKKEQNS